MYRPFTSNSRVLRLPPRLYVSLRRTTVGSERWSREKGHLIEVVLRTQFKELDKMVILIDKRK